MNAKPKPVHMAAKTLWVLSDACVQKERFYQPTE